MVCWEVEGVSVKTGGSRVGGPELWILDRWVTGEKGDDIYLGSGPLNGGKTLRPALFCIDDGVSSIELIYLEIVCSGLNLRAMVIISDDLIVRND